MKKSWQQSAVETMVRDFKNENGLFKPKIRPEFVRAHKLELDEDVQNALFQLQEKGININELLRKALQTRKVEILSEKDEIAAALKPTDSRYIQVKTKRVLKKEHGDCCSIYACYKKAVNTHHTRRFAISKEHNPNFLAPLCKEHHEIAHVVDMKVQFKKQEALL